MFLIRDDLMFPVGFGTVILYLASLTFFSLAIFFQGFFLAGVALGVLFFLIASAIIGAMVRQRIES